MEKPNSFTNNSIYVSIYDDGLPLIKMILNKILNIDCIQFFAEKLFTCPNGKCYVICLSSQTLFLIIGNFDNRFPTIIRYIDLFDWIMGIDLFCCNDD